MKHRSGILRDMLLVSSVSLLAACAGSGGAGAVKPTAGSATGAARASPTPTPTPTATATPTATPTQTRAPAVDSGAAAAATNAAPSAAQNATSTAATGAETRAASAQTPEERRTALDRKLDDSLGKFDRELSGERERVAHERDARAAQAGSAVTEGPNSDMASDKKRESSRAPGSRPGDLHSDRAARDAKVGAGDSTPDSANKNGAAGRNIPDGSDDDIVARRLRKAAEQETDPELKARLWQEYVEYKRSGQNKS